MKWRIHLNKLKLSAMNSMRAVIEKMYKNISNKGLYVANQDLFSSSVSRSSKFEI